MKTEAPSLMTGESMRAILRDIDPKSQTRRIPKPANSYWGGHPNEFWKHCNLREARPDNGHALSEYGYFHVPCHVEDQGICPRCDEMGWTGASGCLYPRYGNHWESLWTRETWDFRPMHGKPEKNGCQRELIAMIGYRADDHVSVVDVPPSAKGKVFAGWRPSIFMPRWASRADLKALDVRAQMVQEISEKDVRAEGVVLPPTELFPRCNTEDKLRLCFERLWDSINGKRYPWSENWPVWAVGFEEVKR